MNKRIRLMAAVLALCIALTLGLCGCTPKTESRKENAPAREGVSTYGAGENLAPDGTPFETVYVPGILELDRSLLPVTRFKTSPNGLYAFDDLSEKLYEFDAQGHCLREWEGTYDDFEALTNANDGWRLTYRENKADPADRSTEYQVLRTVDGQETEVLSFRTESGVASLIGQTDSFLIYKMAWDENGEGTYTLESYDAAGTLTHTQNVNEWMEIYPTGTEIFFLGHDSYEVFRYDPESFSLISTLNLQSKCNK